MELFSVTCITCRTKLKVRHASAIGQILPCPKCGGMVQIAPPAGWTPPQPSAEEKRVAVAKAPVADAPGSLPARAAAAVGPQEDVDSQADDAPLTPPALAAPPGEDRLRWIILGCGAAVAAAIVGFGVWASISGDEEVAVETPIDVPLAAVSPTPTPIPPRPTASSPKPSATVTATAATTARPPLAVASASMPAAIPAPVPTPSPTRPAPPVSPQPSPTAPPVAAPSATIPPPPVPQPPVPLPPVAPPPQMIDLAARLNDKLPELSLDKLALKQSLDLLSQLSTIRINYDWDALTDPGLLDRPVTLDLRDLTTGQALEKILSSAGLASTPVGDQLLVGPATIDRNLKIVEYPVADLVGDDAQGVPRLIELIRDFVAPEAWPATEVSKAIGVTGTKLAVSQSPAVHRELASFLDRLRLARGKSPRDSKATLTTRLAQARDVWAKPVTMNFRPGEPLPTVLAFLEAATGATITVDYLSLMTAGFQGTEPIGCAAVKHPLSDVLTALCEPRAWSWRVVGEKTFDLTTRDASRRRPYVEFYKLPPPGEGILTGSDLMQRLRTQLTDEGWRSSGGRGDVAFDEPSRTLLVRQHQDAHRRIEKLLTELHAPVTP